MADRLSRMIESARERYGVNINVDELRAKIVAAEDAVVTREVIG